MVFSVVLNFCAGTGASTIKKDGLKFGPEVGHIGLCKINQSNYHNHEDYNNYFASAITIILLRLNMSASFV